MQLYPLLLINSIVIVRASIKNVKRLRSLIFLGSLACFLYLGYKMKVVNKSHKNNEKNLIKYKSNNLIRGDGYYDKYSSLYKCNMDYSCAYFSSTLSALYPGIEFYDKGEKQIVNWCGEIVREIDENDTIVEFDWELNQIREIEID